eukprot:3487848-Amphidinium_carterae.1
MPMNTPGGRGRMPTSSGSAEQVNNIKTYPTHAWTDDIERSRRDHAHDEQHQPSNAVCCTVPNSTGVSRTTAHTLEYSVVV